MCFIIAVIASVFAFNFYMADNLLGALGAAVTALFFIGFMIRNMLKVKKMKENKDDN